MKQLNGLAAELHDGISLAVMTATGSVMLLEGRGIMPLWRLYKEAPRALKGALVADKVIGLGAAAVMAEAGIAACHAPAVSGKALDFLEKHGIKVYADDVPENIINRSGTGPCPLESRLDGKKQSDYLAEIAAFVDDIVNGRPL
ncbi:MAG: DUF1893 domain-containing protein [Bacteroidales bacterium]|nr:DUF1893 domain-containing protein [Bacteroidales bacterium]